MTIQNKLSFSFVNPLLAHLGENFFNSVPTHPGVYLMLDCDNTILDIGKAKCLRSRLKQYAQAKPGKAPDRTLEMIESVSTIQWLLCETEQKALERESELLHAIRPPFNVIGTEPNHYLFIGIRKTTHLGNIDVQLSSRTDISKNNYRGPCCIG